MFFFKPQNISWNFRCISPPVLRFLTNHFASSDSSVNFNKTLYLSNTQNSCQIFLPNFSFLKTLPQWNIQLVSVVELDDIDHIDMFKSFAKTQLNPTLNHNSYVKSYHPIFFSSSNSQFFFKTSHRDAIFLNLAILCHLRFLVRIPFFIP